MTSSRNKNFLPDANIKLAREAISSEFPALEIVDVQAEYQGMDNYTFLVNHKWIFRFPKDGEHRMEQELWVLEALKGKTRLKIPVVEYVGSKTAFMGYRKIEGKVLGRGWNDLPEGLRRDNVNLLAEFIGQIHEGTSVKDALLKGVPQGLTRWAKPSSLRTVLKEKAGPRPWMDFAMRSISRFERYSEEPGREVVLHQDLHGDNFVFDDRGERLVGVIDFGDVGVGDIHRDFFPFCWIGFSAMDQLASAYEKQTGSVLDRRRIKDYCAIDNLSDVVADLTAGLSRFSHCLSNLETFAALEAKGKW